MNITEEQKQEADRVVKKYKYLYDVIHTEVDAIRCAIQDRQSVLDMLKAIDDRLSHDTVAHEIQSLTAQIEYLKNKT